MMTGCCDMASIACRGPLMRLCVVLAILAVVPGQSDAQQPSRQIERPVGLRLFLATGCGACHRIDGTEADGEVGPDLTDLASRKTISGILPLTKESLFAWIQHTQEIKPGCRMPSFDMLPKSETIAIVDYLMTPE